MSPVREACRRQQALEVVVARSAGAQVRGDARQLLLGFGAGEQELDVDVKGGDRLLAADVARIGLQEAPESLPAVHVGITVSGPRYPSASSERRSLRRASNSDL